jgi:hypothetical protein
MSFVVEKQNYSAVTLIRQLYFMEEIMNTDSSTEIPEVVTTEPQDVRNTRRTMHLHDAILKVCKVSDDQFTDDIRGFVGDTVSHDRMFEEIWVENPAGDWVSQDKSARLGRVDCRFA